jgi:PhzF family phenazine biosynthesis protein
MAATGTTRARFFHISSFTKGTRLLGNPAGVVLLPAGCAFHDSTLLRCALELNLSETAFLSPLDPSAAFETASAFFLRWFSPKKEVALCGHGTLAAAHALVALGNASPTLAFHTLSGALVVSVNAFAPPTDPNTPARSDLTMNFPCNAPSPRDPADPAVRAIADILLGRPASAQEAQQGAFRCFYSARGKKAVLVLPPGSEALIASLEPSVDALLAVEQPEGSRIEGVTVACAAAGGAAPAAPVASFSTRYWSPWNLGKQGEDPVNGSSHTLLAPLFSQLLGLQGGAEMTSTQLSPRGGQLRVAVLPCGERVTISGEATTVCEGHLWLVA